MSCLRFLAAIPLLIVGGICAEVGIAIEQVGYRVCGFGGGP